MRGIFYKDKLEMESVKLLSGIFKKSQDKGKEYLLFLDLDRLVAPFYEAVGKEPKKNRYGGWEAMGISGHSLGHWLSASSYMYEATKDEILLKKLFYAINELEIIQSFDEKGYLSGFPRKCFDTAFEGEFEVSNFELAGHWVPWYSIHKVFAGLLDVYKITDNKKALDILIKLSDWAYEGTKNMTEESFQKMITCEIGGMNDTFAELYLLTSDKRYLELSKKFSQNSILNPLSESIDELEGKHGNSQIPKVLGAARLFYATGDEYYKNVAKFFFNQIAKYRTYVIGGNSRGEHLGPLNDEGLGVTTTETCNTYNMLKLAEILFDWEQKAEYMDFYERALFNHILPSQDPDNGTKTYFVSTEPGHFKIYCTKEESFWCCTGTGMENPARYNKSIYYKKEDILYINQFISSEYSDIEEGIKIIQRTNLPSSKRVKFEILNGSNIKILKIRKPTWLLNFEINLNGVKKEFEIDKNYICIENVFAQGDILELIFDLKPYVYRSKDNRSKISFMYGPVVLAGAFGTDNMPLSDNCISQMDYSDRESVDVAPLIASEEELLKSLEKISDTPLVFSLKNQDRIIELRPFYDIAHERYTLYWERYDKKEDYKPKNKNSKEIKIMDRVSCFEQQSEIDHSFTMENSYGDYCKSHKKFYRYAEKNGYFSYDLRVKNAKQYFLEIEELIFSEENFDFVISLDDIVLFRASMRMEREELSKIYKMELNPDWLKDKEKVNITIRGNGLNETGKISNILIKTK